MTIPSPAGDESGDSNTSGSGSRVNISRGRDLSLCPDDNEAMSGFI